MQTKPLKSTRCFLSLLVVLLTFVFLCGEVFARGSSGGSRSFSSGSRSSGSSSSSRSSSTTSMGSSSSSFSGSSSWGGKSSSPGLTTSGSRGSQSSGPFSTSTPSQPGSAGRAPTSKADMALYEQAKSKGTAYKTRDEAVSAFKAQNESKYKNQFSSQPSSRPDYIPQYYTGPNGSRYSVDYRPDLGGYGYYDPSLGRWMLYSVMADAVMMGMLMHNHGYYYGAPPVMYHSSGWGFFSSIGTGIFIALVVAAIARMFSVRRRY